MKSSKKLFAILTLVAFLMTLVPMAAFAAPATYSAAASEVDATNTTLDVYANTDDLAKLTITFQDENGPVNAGDVTFYVKSDRDAEMGYVQGDDLLVAASMASAAGQAITATTTSTGKVYVYVGSRITGTAKISIYNALGAEDGLLIGSADIKIAIGDGAVSLAMTNDDVWNGGAGTSVSHYTGDVDDDVELVATVKDGIKAVEGKEVKFQKKFEGGSFTTIATGVTDEDGEASYYFKETKSGAYEYRIKYDDDSSNVVFVDLLPGDIAKFEAKTVDGTKIANKKASDIQFYVKDRFDNLIKSAVAAKFKVAAAPEDSSFVDDTYGANVTTDANGVATLAFTPDKVGTYTIRVAEYDEATVRTYADIKVEALTFGDTTTMSFKLYNNAGKEVTTLARVYGNDAVSGVEKSLAAGTLVTYLVDENGVKVKAAVGDVEYASSDIASVTFGGTDLAGVAYAENVIVIKGGAKDVTFSVLDPESNVVGTYALNVVGSPASLKFTPVVSGKTAAVTMQYVDSTGENSYNVADEEYSIVTPAKVSAANVKKFDATGKATFEVTAEQGGQYAITVMTNLKKIVGTFTVTIAADAAPVIGAKNVTMFIGAPGYTQDGAPKVSDVAPFIKDGRTFVAIRPVAEAFGATIGWNEATQTVTLTRSDVTVTIVIGSNALTVVKGGVTSTVTADVAAFIKDGRTVLPFRAVGEAFGATVNFDAATQAVTYVQ